MKTTIIIIAIVLLIGGGFITHRFSNTVSETTNTANRVLDLAERFEEILGSTHRIDDLLDILEESKPILDSLLIIVGEHDKKLDKIDKDLSNIPQYEIPDIDYIHPSTYEECLGELEKVVDVNEQLVNIINQNEDHIILLIAKIDSQNSIIETQANIIDIQAKDIDEIRERWEDFRSAIRRERIISYTIMVGGIIVAIIF